MQNAKRQYNRVMIINKCRVKEFKEQQKIHILLQEL